MGQDKKTQIIPIFFEVSKSKASIGTNNLKAQLYEWETIKSIKRYILHYCRIDIHAQTYMSKKVQLKD